MTTNLLATVVVTLVTNVVPSDNAVMEPDQTIMYATYPPQYGQRIKTPATESYLTTNITEHVEVTITMPDGPHVLGYDRLLSSVTAILKKQETWKAEGLRTNTVAIEQNGQWSVLTNVVMTNYGGILLYDHKAQ